MKTDIWPSVQFNFEWLDENPTRGMNDSDKVYLERHLPFPGCGLVHISLYSARVLITTTTPPIQHEQYQMRFEERLRDALKELEIL